MPCDRTQILTFGNEARSHLPRNTQLKRLNTKQPLNENQISNREQNVNKNHETTSKSDTPWELFFDNNPREMSEVKREYGADKTLYQLYQNLSVSDKVRKTDYRYKYDRFRHLGKSRMAANQVTHYLNDVFDKMAPVSVDMVISCSPNLMCRNGRVSSPQDMLTYGKETEECRDLHKAEIQRQLYRAMSIAASRENNVFVTPLCGGGLFINGLNDKEQGIRKQLIVNAFVDAVIQLEQENKQKSLQEMVLCVPDPALYETAKGVLMARAEEVSNFPITLAHSGSREAMFAIQQNNPKARICDHVAGHDCNLGGGYRDIYKTDRLGPAEESAFMASDAPRAFLNSVNDASKTFTELGCTQVNTPRKITHIAKFCSRINRSFLINAALLSAAGVFVIVATLLLPPVGVLAAGVYATGAAGAGYALSAASLGLFVKKMYDEQKGSSRHRPSMAQSTPLLPELAI